ncbi:hypothetical protein PV326_005465 [Microctonus aethiopoides]|nr:hypothetical protein PV326_005465 [Microctonus aethiopoides]
MSTTRFIIHAAIIVFVAFTYVRAVPVQMRGDTLGLSGGVYTQPELAEALERSYAALEWAEKNREPLNMLETENRNLDHIGGGNLLRRLNKRSPLGLDKIAGTRENGHISEFSRQTRHGLDSLSGATFGESKRYTLPRKSEWPNNINGLEIYEGSAKRNIDEIDRTGFDNFLKRNFDEIDRSGWDSFVKRRMIDSYLAAKQH